MYVNNEICKKWMNEKQENNCIRNCELVWEKKKKKMRLFDKNSFFLNKKYRENIFFFYIKTKNLATITLLPSSFIQLTK